MDLNKWTTGVWNMMVETFLPCLHQYIAFKCTRGREQVHTYGEG